MLDRDLERLGVQSYGVSVTTLEEVFLKVGHALEKEKLKDLGHPLREKYLTQAEE